MISARAVASPMPEDAPINQTRRPRQSLRVNVWRNHAVESVLNLAESYFRFAGIGERPEDLRVFDAESFVDAMLPETLGA